MHIDSTRLGSNIELQRMKAHRNSRAPSDLLIWLPFTHKSCTFSSEGLPFDFERYIGQTLDFEGWTLKFESLPFDFRSRPLG